MIWLLLLGTSLIWKTGEQWERYSVAQRGFVKLKILNSYTQLKVHVVRVIHCDVHHEFYIIYIIDTVCPKKSLDYLEGQNLVKKFIQFL